MGAGPGGAPHPYPSGFLDGAPEVDQETPPGHQNPSGADLSKSGARRVRTGDLWLAKQVRVDIDVSIQPRDSSRPLPKNLEEDPPLSSEPRGEFSRFFVA